MTIFQSKSVIQRKHWENDGQYWLGYDLERWGRGLLGDNLRVSDWNDRFKSRIWSLWRTALRVKNRLGEVADSASRSRIANHSTAVFGARNAIKLIYCSTPASHRQRMEDAIIVRNVTGFPRHKLNLTSNWVPSENTNQCLNFMVYYADN
jgi:hypothetical protein